MILSIIKDGDYWTALFERIDASGYSVAKATISQGEPSNEKVEIFLKNLKRNRLQFTDPIDRPVTTQKVFVEKKLKYEKDRIVEVELKNIYGTAKSVLHKQKAENNAVKKEKENAENRKLEDYKMKVKEEKRKGK
jgi:Protein of unknown function (DUF2992)